jgi:hypothetical protein
MGCFSFLCKVSGEPANSTSFNGSPCYLFLLKNGKVIEEMYGNYNSYGCVFNTEKRTDVEHELYDSFEWNMDWGDVVDLMYDGPSSNGIAMVLEKYYTGVPPTSRSEPDDNQGWGNDGELLGDVSSNRWKRVTNPYHKVY